MTALHFHDGTDEILTSSWTARPTRTGTEIAFVWGASELSWFSSATGVYRTTLSIPFPEFLRLVGRGGIVELMKYRK